MHVPRKMPTRRHSPFAAVATLATLGLAIPACAQTQTYTLTTLATFSGFANGGNPRGAVRLSPDGKTLLGTTKYGGGYSDGTVFSLPVTGGAVTTLATFRGPNGADPSDSLTAGPDGTLYGTTVAGGSGGGANGYGTVFSISPVTGALTTLATFNSANGSDPVAGLTLIGSTLFGTTYTGGLYSGGTVFSVSVTGGSLTTLVNFTGYPNGAFPQSAVTPSADGRTFYGTTTGGGNNGNGTLFSVPVTGGAVTTLTTFVNGATPYAGLTPSADGKTLFGTTYSGPTVGGNGTVFALDTSTGTVTTLAVLSYANGANPYAGLTLSADGKTLFGTATSGGSTGDGTVFSLPVTGGAVTTLVNFTGANGANPVAGLTLGVDGTLYGTTYGSDIYGGAGGVGTVFALTPTPEPSQTASLAFGTLGLAGLALKARRRSGGTPA